MAKITKTVWISRDVYSGENGRISIWKTKPRFGDGFWDASGDKIWKCLQKGFSPIKLRKGQCKKVKLTIEMEKIK